MTVATLPAANGRAGVSPGPSIAFTHVFDNAGLGSPPLTSQPFTVSGNPLLVSLSASALIASAGQLASYPTKLNSGSGVAAGTPEVFINPAQQHFPVVRSWALASGVAAGEVTLTSTPTNTLAHADDTLCATVCELGPGAPLAVRALVPPTSAYATVAGQPALYLPFVSFGGRLLIRASASGQQPSGSSAKWITFAIEVDGQEVARTELLPPPSSVETGWHHATVPVDVLVEAGAGPHVVAVRPLAVPAANINTFVDANDFTSVLVLEQTGPEGALEISPVLVNAPTLVQNGGGTSAYATFTSGGGTLVLLVSTSAWSTAPNELNVTVQLDGQPLVTNGNPATLHGGVNTPSMHIPLISNDFVVPGVGAGNHTISLVADANTVTDYNDRVSITVIELGPSAG
jgi:hypothetical protein